MIVPFAAASGTTTSAVTENDLFLMLRTLDSDRRPIPPNSTCELPRTSCGRPAMSALSRSAVRSSSGSTLYFVASMQPQALELVQLVGHLLRRGRSTGSSPASRRRAPRRRRRTPARLRAAHDPRRAVLGHRAPALVVDAAVAEHLEVLQVVALGLVRRIEAVGHRGALDRRLHDAVDHRRMGQPGDLEDRRGDIDDVAELIAGLAPGRDPVRPAHDRAVAGAAPVRGDLLGPLVGRVHRVRPADRVVVVGLGRAELVEHRGHELRRLELGHRVEVRHLVEGAVERALGRGAVVADDHVDERVVERAELIDRVDQPADVVVGVLHEGGVDLHLAGEHRLHLLGHLVPGRDLRVALASARRRPGSRRAPSGARTSPRAACPSPSSNWPRYFSIHSVGHVVRRVRRAGREVHEERLVGHQRLLLAHPRDRLVGEILGQVVALLRRSSAARSASCPHTAPGSTGCPRRR